MNCGDVKEYKIEIGNKEYTFKMNFKALAKFQERYENSIQIFNDCISEKNQYVNEIKLLACCCVERDWEEEELAEALSFDFPTLKVLDGIIYNMIVGSMVIKGDKENKKGKVKNEKASQVKEK